MKVYFENYSIRIGEDENGEPLATKIPGDIICGEIVSTVVMRFGDYIGEKPCFIIAVPNGKFDCVRVEECWHTEERPEGV